MKDRTLSLGFSPCPNDCFIFDAMLHEKVDTEGLKFKSVIEDVEALNKRTINSSLSLPFGKGALSPSERVRGAMQLDITKLSFFAFAQVQKKYSLLDSGSALGFGVGPLVIKKLGYGIKDLNSSKFKIAIPGRHTTANFLFSLAFPKATNKVELLFSEIEKAVLDGKTDAGVIIHENRFTYRQKGLKKIIDLGAWWKKKTKLPIPLGGIAIKKTFQKEIQRKVERVIRKSVEYAFANPESSKAFIKKHSQEMDDDVIKQHINLYVNKYSLSLGIKGRKAVNLLLQHTTRINSK